MSEGKLSCASPEMIAPPQLSDLNLCSVAGKGPDGELAYSRCASWEHGNMGALGQEGGVGCADGLQRKFGWAMMVSRMKLRRTTNLSHNIPLARRRSQK